MDEVRERRTIGKLVNGVPVMRETITARELDKLISDSPTVDAVPVVHARWIDLRESYKDIPEFECSNCKSVIIGLSSNFCPKCGTRMDGEEDDVRKSV